MEYLSWNAARREKIMPDSIMKRTDLTMGAKVLYAHLRDSAGRKDHCWPSQLYLAVSLRQSVRSVQNHLKKLSALGLVAIKKRPWRGNIYYILDQQAAVPSPGLAKVPSSAMTSPRFKSDTPSRPASSTTPYIRQKADTTFQRLWDAYPRSEARKPALRYWHRLSRAGTAPAVELLLASIKENLEHNPRWKRGYVPFLVTWLQDRRWEDLLPVENASSVPEKQAKTVVLQKEEYEAPAPIFQLPEAASKRLREALSLWPGSLSDAEAAMVRVVWGLLHSKNRLPSPTTIVDAVKSMHVSFPRWLNDFYFRGSSCFS